jgi:CHAT domain-containing protein
MRQVRGWVVVMGVVCWAAGTARGDTPPTVRLREAQAASDAASAAWDAGRYAEAMAKGEQALALREAALGDTHPEVAQSLDWLGAHYLLQGNPVRAEPLLQRALALREAALGKEHPEVAQTLSTLARVYADQWLSTRAEPLHERALAIREAAFGKDHPLVADSLNALANLHAAELRDARAEPLYQRALAIREAVLGANHPEVAQTLYDLANLYHQQARFERAGPLYERALAIQEAVLGKSHPLVAETLQVLAFLAQQQGAYARARPLYERALAIQEVALGKSQPDAAVSLEAAATIYWELELHDRAEPLMERALAIREATLGKSHPRVARSLVFVANFHHERGRYGRAASLHERALAIVESSFGGNHPIIADLLRELAHIYQDLGLYDRARQLYERAVAIQERAHGEEHRFVGRALADLANLYVAQGLYGQAEPLCTRVIAIYEAALGSNHPSVAPPLSCLANLYVAQGEYGKAGPLYERVLAIREATHGEHHTLVALALSELANLYVAQQQYGKARPLYERAISILETVHGKSNDYVAEPLHSLANLHVAQGEYRRAEPLHTRALAIQEASLGSNHPQVARSLNHLAGFYSAQASYGRARPLYERALAIQEASLGKSHPDVAATLNHLAVAHLAQQRLDSALPLFTRAFALSDQRLRQEALGFTESRLSSFLQLLRADEERLYALLRAHPSDARVRRLAFAAALLLKGRSVEESASISRTVYQSLGEEDRDIFERLRGLRTQLAQLSLQGHGPGASTDSSRRLAALSEQSAALEADLARRSAPLRALAALPSPTEIVDRVAAALPRGSAFVDFIAYVDRPLMLEAGGPRPQGSSQPRYLALVLLPDATLHFRDLGPAGPIDSAASRLRDALANRDAAFEAPAQALYQLAFQPLLPLLGATRRLFLSPDGQLALVPFAVLHDGHGLLVDAFDFTYVSSGRSLLTRPQEGPAPDSVVVLADPDFHGGRPAGPRVHPRATERSMSTLRERLAQRAWAPTPLPGTRQEAEAIQRLLPQAQLFLGAEATGERLWHLPAPGILHLATHGFFLEDAPEPTGSRAVAQFHALGDRAAQPPDPLLRSGLIFAGARGPAPSGALVTALELAGLNLWGTQLVVLSACDTGRGDVRLGQGVYGLRSAFLVAGAETVVMSLWKVNDETTRELMEAYYRHLLAGQGRALALREAMRELRRTLPHPHYWAPFIAMGRDTPLHLP